MKTNAEQRFKELIKETVENTDFEDELKARIRELGYDKCPDIETLQKRAQSRKHERKRLRHSRALKIAAVVLAIFIVSSAMSIFANSNVALASRFAVHNFMFSLQNGFTSTDFQFYSTDMGRELVIDKEEQIPIGRNFLRELKTPKYIPANYSFVSLHVTNNLRNEYTVLFTYESDENTLILIRQQSLTLHNILDQIGGVQQDFFIDGDRIFFAPCVTTGNNTIFAFTSSDLIQISGILDLDDLVNIFKMLK